MGEVICKAEDKLEEITKKDYAENLTDFKRDEYLRRQLIDEVSVACSKLATITSSIQNNYTQFNSLDLLTCKLYIDQVRAQFELVLEQVRRESDF